MNLHRLGTILFAAVAAISAGACGGGDEGGTAPTGPHYHYVVNKIAVPTMAAQAMQYGLDLNGDGSVDNKVGGALALLSSYANIQAAVDRSLLSGKLNVLADVQTPDFSSSSGTGVQLFLGDNPQPAACSGTSDTVNCTDANPAVCTGCGHHLTNGTFSIAANSPEDPAITGKIAGGTFTGGPGNLTLVLSFGDAAPIRFDLVQARIKASGMSENAIGSVSGATISEGFTVGGIVTQENMDGTVFPGLAAQVSANVMKACPAAAAPDCTCSLQTLLTVLKGAPPYQNCQISTDEIKKVAATFIQPDQTVDGKPAYSAGIKASAVKATFTVPGQ